MARLHAKIGTFRQLEILLAVYKTGSITQAAKELFLTQPTVSMQLKKLSDSVGTALYNQVGRKLIFTEAGLVVVDSAREVMGCIEHLDMKLSDLKGLKAGTLRLAVVTTAKYFIPHLLGEFIKHYPDIDIDFKVGNRQQIIDRMGKGEDDFYVFSHPPRKQELDLHEFLPNPLVAIAEEGHPLSLQKKIPLETFLEQSFLMRESGSGTRYAIENYMEKMNIKLNSRMTIESNEAIKHAIMSGLGVSILSSHTLAFGGSVGLSRLDVEDLPIMTKWYLGHLKSMKMSIVAETFLEYVIEHGRKNLLDACK